MSGHNVFITMGASNHSTSERECNDYYATEPKATELLLERERFSNVLEPACGEGHIVKVLESHNIETTCCDIIDRGYGTQYDFFAIKEWEGDIVTNPPYKNALDFVKHALDIVPIHSKVAMFLRLQFLEGKARGEFFKDNPPKKVYVSSSRLHCAKNGEFDKYPSSAIAYAWFVWEKGFKGKPVIEWIN